MRSHTRREAIRLGCRLIIGATTYPLVSAFTSGCTNKEPNQDVIAQIREQTKEADISNIKLTVVYDNIKYSKETQSDWGFSCLIEGLDNRILFDAGRFDNYLLSNMAALKIDPHQVDNLFISHDHPDHIGGVMNFIETRPQVNVALVKSFRSGFKKAIRKRGADITEIDRANIVTNNCFSTGEMKSFVRNEHALVIRTNKGSIIITGCAHPGVVNIVERAKMITNNEVLLVMGGFHLLMDDGSSIRKKATRLKEIGVQYLAPSHCTGEEARRILAKAYGDRFLDSGVGRIITSSDFIG